MKLFTQLSFWNAIKCYAVWFQSCFPVVSNWPNYKNPVDPVNKRASPRSLKQPGAVSCKKKKTARKISQNPHKSQKLVWWSSAIEISTQLSSQTATCDPKFLINFALLSFEKAIFFQFFLALILVKEIALV